MRDIGLKPHRGVSLRDFDDVPHQVVERFCSDTNGEKSGVVLEQRGNDRLAGRLRPDLKGDAQVQRSHLPGIEAGELQSLNQCAVEPAGRISRVRIGTQELDDRFDDAPETWNDTKRDA